MKTKLCVIAVATLVAWGLKRHYADARADELEWMLQPTARLVSALTGTTFVRVPGEGHVSYERLFVIEKACAGVNFMIAAFALVVLARVPHVRSAAHGAALLSAALVVSYVTAIVVNAVRITAALWLASHAATATVSAAQVHRVEGIVVYFVALLLLYEGVQRLERRHDVSRSMSRW